MNYFAVGFVCVATVTAVGVDYVTQARAHGAAPGAFAVSGYLASVSARMGGVGQAPEDPPLPVAANEVDPVLPAPSPAAVETSAETPRTPEPVVTRLEPGQDRAGEDAGPRRLTLSGGRTCLGTSAGRLCD